MRRVVLACAGALLLAGFVGYLAIQPVPSFGQGAATGAVLVQSPSPTPWRLILPSAPVATPAPVTYVPSVPPPCSKNVIAMQATVSMAGGVLTIKVVDQNRRPVACAWVMPVTGGGLEGATGADGALSVALSDMPAHFHSVSQAQIGAASTAFEYQR